MQVVWLKRDLRLRDHAPLHEALARGPVLLLYIHEPSALAADTFDPRHLRFVLDALDALEEDLLARGGVLQIRVGEVVDVLAALHRERPIDHLWSHEETGDARSFARDLAVRRWADAEGVPWVEIPQHGVVRRLADRDGWAARWQRRMDAPRLATPAWIPGVPGLARTPRPTARDLGVTLGPREQQRGGSAYAHELLDSFLARRGARYRWDMSSPNTAWDGCSRLSAHLAYGTISIRDVHQALERRRRALRAARKAGEAIEPGWLSSLSSFAGRLRWHCHFIQKLEDEPRLQFENMSRAYDGLREDAFDEERFEAWREGRTGYPMVDASMRCLRATGWINFRMRAMLMSFASYHLWLDWRPTSVVLARRFLDYEPGIHYSQCQMQSGVTGINAVRIYSPIKQAHDQDPDGRFIRTWIPELEGVPSEHLAEPHRMDRALQQASGCILDRDYPAPIVEHKPAYALARDRMRAVRRREDTRAEAQAVYERHGSRRRPRQRRGAPSP